MKTLLKLIALPFLLSVAQPANAQLNNFIMFWLFTNPDGTNQRDHEDICKCGTVYVKNTSTANGSSIGSSLATGVYRVSQVSPITSFIVDIPANTWPANSIKAINIPCNLNFDYPVKNLRIQYVGTGATSYPGPSGNMHFTNYLNTIDPPTVSAGPDKTSCASNNVTLNGSATAGSTFLWTPGGFTSATPTVNPSVTTTYTLTASKTTLGWNPTGAWTQTLVTCSNSDQMTVNVLPKPTLHLQDYSLCYDETMPVLDGGPSPVSYQWSFIPTGSSTVISAGFGRYVNTALYGYGTYNVIVYGANGCFTTGSSQVLLDASAFGNIDPDFTYNAAFTGVSTTINASSTETGNHWWGIYSADINCNVTSTFPIVPPYTGGPSAVFTGLPLGQHYVIAHKVKRNPCNQWAEQTHCSFQSEKIILHLSPNPTNGIFTVSVDDFNEGKRYTVSIYNMMGELKMRKDMNSSQQQFDLSSLQNDTYTVHVTDGEYYTYERIIKN